VQIRKYNIRLLDRANAIWLKLNDMTQNRETLADDKELKLIETHLGRVNEITISMAKTRRDECTIPGMPIPRCRQR
jgi:hypothetical protein